MNEESASLVVAPATTLPSTKAPGSHTPRARFAQNQKLANVLAEGSRVIQTALSTPALAAPLAMIGYGLQELQAAQTLLQTAETKFAARQAAQAAAARAVNVRELAWQAAYDDFIAYRATVQANYQGGERSALGADGKISVDRGRFIANARGAYSAARQGATMSVLGRYGFDDTRFNEVNASLDRFAASEAEAQALESASSQVVVERDDAVAALDAWLRKFRKIAKVTVKKQPALQALFTT